MKFILNMGHPFTQYQLDEIEQFGIPAENCIHTPLQLNEGDNPRDIVSAAFDKAARQFEFVDGIGTSGEWQKVGLMLPGLNLLAALATAHYRGRTNYFPTVVTLKREGVPPRFNVSGTIDVSGAYFDGAGAQERATPWQSSDAPEPYNV